MRNEIRNIPGSVSGIWQIRRIMQEVVALMQADAYAVSEKRGVRLCSAADSNGVRVSRVSFGGCKGFDDIAEGFKSVAGKDLYL